MSFSKSEYLGRIFSFMSFLQVLAATTPPFFTWLVQIDYFDHDYGKLNWVLVATSLLSGVLPMFWFVKNLKSSKEVARIATGTENKMFNGENS